MNAVEIEEAVSSLATALFDASEFPYAFLAAFGNKETTIKRLRAGSSNASDIPGGVLQRNNIHIATCAPGGVEATLKALRESPKTSAAKAKFVLATDGVEFQAEDLGSGDTVASAYPDFAKHFGFFLPLAGISTVRQIAHNPIDIKATGRLNKLYVELLKDNEDWGTDARRPELNQFMARLVFCFFAESTGIFQPRLFTETIRQMTDPSGANTHEVISELFRVMDTKREELKARNFRPWAENFPYVNGSLFAGKADCPRFSRTARAYLLRAGDLDWKEINPDIFGSMIQAVADDDERGSLGLHYTSVPNILKVLDPLFLDDLRAQLDAAGDNVRKLRNLRRRIASVRVFDPACGSGNFLVIAYIKMREIEHEIVKRLSEKFETQMKLENFYGIEIRSFPVEIAKLSLLIAEFQCNVRFYGEDVAWLNVLPLHRTGQVHVGNALRMDWQEICPPAVRMEQRSKDLFDVLPEQAEVDFDAKVVETYICGNPPYYGSVKQNEGQKSDLKRLFAPEDTAWKSLDYVAGWVIKASRYDPNGPMHCAFVSTKSICQGEQVQYLWPELYNSNCDIPFVYQPFEWANLAKYNAGVTVVIIGMCRLSDRKRKIYCAGNDGQANVNIVDGINPYLFGGKRVIVRSMSRPLDDRPTMVRGNLANDGGHLLLTPVQARQLLEDSPLAKFFIRRFVGSTEFINSTLRFCLWITDEELVGALLIPEIQRRVDAVRGVRAAGGLQAYGNVSTPHRFVFAPHRDGKAIVIPRVSSINRKYLPVGYIAGNTIVSDRAIVIYNGEPWVLAILASKLHQCWISTVCVRMRMDYSYSNTLGWNTFWIPKLTERNKVDLTRCAEDILLAREAHFPATLADLYDPDAMPDDLRKAHARNDETLERIYIGRRFRNDTERLEKLFEMYAKMAEVTDAKSKTSKRGKVNA